MKNTKLHLFIIKDLLDARDKVKLERFFVHLFEPDDFNYIIFSERKDSSIFICCFEEDKISLLEKELWNNDVLLKSEDISEMTIQFNYCKELQEALKHSNNHGIVEEFILKNLDLDVILDKMCELGMDSLNSVEKKFLKEF